MKEIRTAADRTFLQKQEVEAGKKAGLTPEEIRIYTEPGLNFMQMRVIREALADGLSPDDAKLVACPWINAETMKELIAEMKQGKKVTVKKRPDFRKWILPAAGAAAAIFTAGFLILEEPKEMPSLELRQDEIRLACGMKFEPEQYVKSRSEAGYELLLPDAFTAERPEVRLALYELKGKEESVRKILRITVVDETAPEIHLLQDRAELLTATKFSCRAYLKDAFDAIDGDLTRRVNCSDRLEQRETQTVLYTVKDRSGNEARTQLTVHFADFDAPAETTAEEEKPEQVPLSLTAAAPVWERRPEPVMEPAVQPVHEVYTEEEYEVIEYSESVTDEIPVSYGETSVEHHYG